MATGASTFSPESNASIVHWTGAPVTITKNEKMIFSMTNGDVDVYGYFDEVGVADDEFRLRFDSQESGKPSIFNDTSTDTTPGTGGAAFQLVGATNYAKNFDAGDVISSSLDFNTSNTLLNFSDGINDAEWAVGSSGYLGLRMDLDSGEYYGWAEIEYPTDSSLVLKDFAYEDTGASIIAGAIPEPNTMALILSILAGSAALYTRRHRD
ncbi:hypothetical protein P0Y35_16780 [Kiritimatiellaeota bacterium B1221]|nr:hypothetical protein [Kiritimatiellaeota bacterium B1221]